MQYIWPAKFFLPQYCVNNVSFNTSALTSLCYHSTVSITFLTIHFTQFTCEFLLPQHCDNNFSYNASTLFYYYSTVSITIIIIPLNSHSLPSQYCINKVFFYTSTLWYHSTVSMTFLTIHIYMWVSAITVLCQ